MNAELAAILPWHNLPYSEQLERKQRFVRQALQSRNLLAPPERMVPSPRIQAARARVKLHSGPQQKLGFFRPRSHDFIAVPLEQVAIQPVVELAKMVEERGFLKEEAEIRSDGEKAVLVLPHPVPKVFRDLPAVSWDNKQLVGDCYLRVEGLRVAPLSFYQVNLEVNRAIIEEVDRQLLSLSPAGVMDVFAGIGNLSARAIRRGVPTVLLEKEGSSCADARFNFREEIQKGQVKILEKDAAKWVAGEAFFEVVVLDPPRAGAPGLLPKLALTRPKAILYLSCDPVSLARDLSELKGYKLEELVLYDMFPGTEHVETLAVLKRA